MAAKKPQSNSKTKSSARVPASQPTSPRLLGKVAVVTGGSRGIGYSIAGALAAEGCSVVITGRNQSTLAKSAAELSRLLPQKARAHKDKGAQIVAEVCDVCDPD